MLGHLGRYKYWLHILCAPFLRIEIEKDDVFALFFSLITSIL